MNTINLKMTVTDEVGTRLVNYLWKNRGKKIKTIQRDMLLAVIIGAVMAVICIYVYFQYGFQGFSSQTWIFSEIVIFLTMVCGCVRYHLKKFVLKDTVKSINMIKDVEIEYIFTEKDITCKNSLNGKEILIKTEQCKQIFEGDDIFGIVVFGKKQQLIIIDQRQLDEITVKNLVNYKETVLKNRIKEVYSL